MRKTIKAFVCAVSALVICAAPNIANYAGISDTTAITAKAFGNGKCIAECTNTPIYLTPGDMEYSNNLKWRFRFQHDGNLVVYPYDHHLDAGGYWYWNSNSGNNYNSVCRLQPDGNLVVYGADGKWRWDSGSYSDDNKKYKKRLYLTNDGTLRIVVDKVFEKTIWDSSTSNRGTTNSRFKNPEFKLVGKYYLHKGKYSLDDATFSIYFPELNSNRIKVKYSGIFYLAVGFEQIHTGIGYIENIRVVNYTNKTYYAWDFYDKDGNMKTFYSSKDGKHIYLDTAMAEGFTKYD